MAKSLRSANIRISSSNKTEKGIVEYSINKIKKILDDWSINKKFSYWLIEHGSNEINDLILNKHFHIVLKFNNPTPFDDVKKKFPYGKIQNTARLNKSIQYLIHKNDKTKKQYLKENIVTNDRANLDKYMLQGSEKEGGSIDQVLEDISTGRIREYNQWEKIPYEMWVKYRTKIENTHIFYKEKIYMDKDRKIVGIFISGRTGTGKTTLAKAICKKRGKTFCISSSSNDPFQDYKGEDVLILDDLRDTTFSYSDLLKILDLHTKSTAKARYHNKFFLGDWIIITSVQPLEDWYFDESPEDKQQLKRRLSEHYQLTDDKIRQFRYDVFTRKYEFVKESENMVKKQMTEKTIPESIIDDMGWESSKVMTE